MNTTQNIKTKLSNSISLKLLVISGLILLMQIPLSMVRGLINERQGLQNQAQRDIGKRWGTSQYVGAPILILNYEKHFAKKDKVISTSFHQQSKSVDIHVNLQAQKRYLGIYEAAVYQSKVNFDGVFTMPKLEQGLNYDMQLFLPIKQIKGIKHINDFVINDKAIQSEGRSFIYNNINGLLYSLHDIADVGELKYSLELMLTGSQQFDVLSVAKSTQVHFKSNWNSPSFVGDYLPDVRNITDTGFEASWQVSQVVQSFDYAEEVAEEYDRFKVQNQTSALSFGVKILIPANIYQVNTRTVKYSFLIIVLTFAGFFLAEMFFKLKLHPFQYLMIGFSISLFYLLLLSISEFLRFNWAFLLSALATIALISGYCSVVLKQASRGFYTAVLFSVLYGFIFVLVKAQQTSLLMGSIGLFLVLACVMYLTRKIDWYDFGNNLEDPIK